MMPSELNPQETSVVLNNQKPSTNPSPKKSVWKKVFLIIALFLILIGVGGYFLYTKNIGTVTEEMAYGNLKNSYVIEDYEDFLKNYPNSQYQREIEQRLQQLKQMQVSWDAIANSSNVQDFVNFKTRFRDVYYDELCDNKVDSLDWMNTRKENTQEAYHFYIESHPQGRYVSMAQQLLETITETQVNPETATMIRERLDGFFEAFGDNKGLEMCTYIVPVLDHFLSKKQATKSDVLEIVERMFTPSIEDCNFLLSNDLIIERLKGKDGEGTYKVTLSIDQHIKRTDAGKTFGSYVADIRMNEQLMITSVQMREISSKKTETQNKD